MSGSHDTRGHRGSRGRVPLPRDAPGTRKSAESSPAKRAIGLRKYTCGRYTRWCKPLTRSHSDSRMSTGNGMGDTQGAQLYNQHLELIRDDEDDGYHSESDAGTDNENDTPHDISQRDSNYGGVSRGIIQNKNVTLRAITPIESNYEGRSRDTSQNLNGISCDTSQRNSINGGESRGTSNRPSIARLGDKFGSYDIHHTICTIMREHLTKPWITFKMVPKDVRIDMYNCFKTRWSTNLNCEQSNFEAFINVLKDRYSDMMYNLKITSTRIARNDGCDIAVGDYKQFKIIRQYPPDSIPDGVWAQMCDLWDSEAWQKKSRIAKTNRDKGNEKAARHTGGSIGYDEYRVLCREPNFREIFLLTHLDKASKTKLLAGELNLNSVNEMFFCNDRSKEAYTSYLEEMIEKNGLDFTVDDPEVWSRVVEPNLKRTRRVYGIGSSDINYVVSGIVSSSSGVTQNDTQQLSQKKIHDLEIQMEVERRSRQELEEEIKKERQERLELQQQMKEFMKKFMQHPSS
ncbi:hypothetical protein R6Q59_013298 [Mikania micrantha]